MDKFLDMAEEIRELDKVIHERIRLAISTILFHKGKMDFNTLKRNLKTSDGNLATHLRTLEQAGYVRVEKRFIGRKPQTLYELTEKGEKAYQNYLSRMIKILKMADSY